MTVAFDMDTDRRDYKNTFPKYRGKKSSQHSIAADKVSKVLD